MNEELDKNLEVDWIQNQDQRKSEIEARFKTIRRVSPLHWDL